jgi:C_GCAxxG_C_C family probable redox protein
LTKRGKITNNQNTVAWNHGYEKTEKCTFDAGKFIIMSDQKNQARRDFEKGFNCAQSVVASFAGEFGAEKDYAYKMASAFGGGINGMGHTCGAVTGALMALGLHGGRTQAGDVARRDQLKNNADAFMKEFIQLHGSLNCRDLLDKARLEDPSKDSYRNCPGFVEDAVEISRKIMDHNDSC